MPILDAQGVSYAAGQPYYDHILTQFYEPLVVDARNNTAVLYAIMQQGPKRDLYGKHVTFPVRFGRNHGVGSIAPGGKFPDPGFQGADQYTASIRHTFARAKIDGASVDASKSSAAAYLDLMDFEIQGLTDDFVQQEQRMMWSDGSGRYAEVTAVNNTAGTTYELTLELNTDIPQQSTCTSPPSEWFLVGQFIACMAEGSGSLALAVVDSIDSDTQITATFSTGTPAANDWVTFAASDDTTYTITSTGYRHEPMGIVGVFNDGNIPDGNGLQVTGAPQHGADGDTTVGGVGFQGQDASTRDYNQGHVFGNGGVPRAVTDPLLQSALSDIERVNNGEVDFMICFHDIYDAYVNQLLPEKRFATTTLNGGHKYTDFNAIPWVKDRHCLRNRVFFMNMKCFYMYEQVPFSIVADDGRKWRALDDSDDMQIVFKKRCQMMVDVRDRAGGVLTDLQAA